MADVRSMLADPDFKALPPEERKKVLAKIAPEFMQLPEAEQAKVLGMPAAQQQQQEAPAMSRFFSSLGEMLNPIPAIKEYIDRPSQYAAMMEGVKGALAKEQTPQTGATVDKAMQANVTNPYAAMAHPVADTAREIVKKASTGDLAGAAGMGVGAAVLAAAPAVLPKILPKSIGPIVKNRLNPVEREAIGYLQEKNVPTTVGQQTGNRMLQRVEGTAENYPGSTGAAHEFTVAQQEALAKEAGALAQKASPVQTDAVGAGQAVQSSAAQRIARLNSFADRMYGDIRKSTAKAKMAVQTGTTESLILGPDGRPMQTPVAKVFEAPVDLNAVRAKLAPVYEDLTKALPIAQREASPGFTALKQVMESGDPYMDAMAFDKTLGAIKSITRNGDNPLLSSRSQGIAKLVIREGEKRLNDALANADPALPQKLRAARTAVRGYHETADLLADLSNAQQEPAALYNRMVSGGDRVYGQLENLQKIAPKEVKIAGRTFLEGLIQKATDEGGFGRAPGVLADWNRLGPRAKQAMFGTQLTRDLDNFFHGAKMVTKPTNASNTAHTMLSRGAFGALPRAGMEMVTGAIAGHPELGALVAAGEVGRSYIAPYITAKMLFTPGGARLLTRAMRTPVGTPAFTKAIQAVNARFLALQNDNSGDEVQ